MIVMIMGVTGAGKTTVGELLAQQLGWEFADADNFHSPVNVEKMRQGIALTDEDRAPWLRSIHDAMAERSAEGRNVVLACSALKRAYRNELRRGLDMRIVYLRGTKEYILSRLTHRTGHYATGTLVASQFAGLEVPGKDEAVYEVDVDQPLPEVVSKIREQLALHAE